MSSLDVAILVAFVAWSLGAGLWSRARAGRSLEEYFLAGRTLPGWAAGCSMAATQFAADTPLVVMGVIATAGLFGLWQLWSYGLAFVLLGFAFAPVWRRAGVLTDAELAELRYSGRAALVLRGVRALLFGVVFNAVVVAMVLFAATLFAQSFLHWQDWLPAALFDPVRDLVRAVGVPLAATNDPTHVWDLTASNLISIVSMTAVALFYSTTGGLRSVVTTDVVQLAIMLVATAVYTLIAVRDVGGLAGLREGLAALEAAGRLGGQSLESLLALGPPEARSASAGLVVVFALQWLLQRNADGTGYLAQRAMACRSDRDARVAALVFAFVQVGLRTLLWVPLGLALLVLFPPDPQLAGEAFTRDREASFVLGMAALLPAGALGLMLTGMLAALMSTIDTHLNWGASYLANDLYARIWSRGLRGREPSPRAQVWVARLSGAALLALSLAVMTQLGSIQAAWKITLVLGAGLGVATVLRWWWWRITAWGELAALLVSFACAPIVLATVESEAARMLVGAAAGSLAAVVVSLAGPATDPAQLRRFIARAQPMGFWGVDAPSDARRRLGRALLASVAAAVSLFAGSIGALRLVVPAAEPQPLRALVLLAVALAALPLWWRALGYLP